MNPIIAGVTGGAAALVFVLGVFLWTKWAKPVWNMVPALKNFSVLIAIAMMLIGFTGGAFAYFGSSLKTASITETVDAQNLPTADLNKCVYVTSGGITGNVTTRQDPNSNNIVFIDVDESSWDTNGKARSEINVTFKCDRTGSTAEDASVEIVAKGDLFKSEVSTTDSSEYNILVTSSRPSEHFAGRYTQTIYLAESATGATTSDTKERSYLTFAEGDKELSLSLLGEVDPTAFASLNNYTQKNVIVSKRINGQDTEVARIIVNKVP